MAMAKIDRCDVYLCMADLSEPRGPSSGWYDTRESVLVRLADTDGQVGWGEAGLRPGVVEAARELGATLPGAGIHDWQALLIEIALTAGLVSTILGTASGAQNVGALSAVAVAGYIILAGLWSSPISGASMNPARTLGPDIVSTDFTGRWVYVLGPMIGATIAVVIIGAVRGLPDKEEREAAQGGALPILGRPSPNGR